MRFSSSAETTPRGRAPGRVTSTISSSARRVDSDQPAARDLGQQRQIDAAVDDELLEPDRAGMNHLQFDHRIVAAHPGEQLRHHHRAQGRGHAEDDLAAGMRLVRADLVAGALDVAQDALRAVEQLLAGLGQPHAAIGAGEQGRVELVLEPLDMPGQAPAGRSADGPRRG